MSKGQENTDWIYDILPSCAGVHVETSWQSDLSSIVTHWIMSSSTLPPLSLSTYMWTSMWDGEHQMNKRRPRDILSRYFQQLQRTTKKVFLWSKTSTVKTKDISLQLPFHFALALPIYTPTEEENSQLAMQQRDRLGFESESVGKSLPITVFLFFCVKPAADCNNFTPLLWKALWEM